MLSAIPCLSLERRCQLAASQILLDHSPEATHGVRGITNRTLQGQLGVVDSTRPCVLQIPRSFCFWNCTITLPFLSTCLKFVPLPSLFPPVDLLFSVPPLPFSLFVSCVRLYFPLSLLFGLTVCLFVSFFDLLPDFFVLYSTGHFSSFILLDTYPSLILASCVVNTRVLPRYCLVVTSPRNQYCACAAQVPVPVNDVQEPSRDTTYHPAQAQPLRQRSTHLQLPESTTDGRRRMGPLMSATLVRCGLQSSAATWRCSDDTRSVLVLRRSNALQITRSFWLQNSCVVPYFFVFGFRVWKFSSLFSFVAFTWLLNLCSSSPFSSFHRWSCVLVVFLACAWFFLFNVPATLFSLFILFSLFYACALSRFGSFCLMLQLLSFLCLFYFHSFTFVLCFVTPSFLLDIHYSKAPVYNQVLQFSFFKGNSVLVVWARALNRDLVVYAWSTEQLRSTVNWP